MHRFSVPLHGGERLAGLGIPRAQRFVIGSQTATTVRAPSIGREGSRHGAVRVPFLVHGLERRTRFLVPQAYRAIRPSYNGDAIRRKSHQIRAHPDGSERQGGLWPGLWRMNYTVTVTRAT